MDMLPLPRFEIRKTKTKIRRRERFHVVLIAANGEPLNVSEKLSSDVAAMTNIEAVIACAPGAEVVRVS